MLSTCTSFAAATDNTMLKHSLVFNVNKTQLIRFSRSHCSSDNSVFTQWPCSSIEPFLGHILTSDLSDNEDIERVRKDFIRKANCMLYSFASCNPQAQVKFS